MLVVNTEKNAIIGEYQIIVLFFLLTADSKHEAISSTPCKKVNIKILLESDNNKQLSKGICS
jgi:hypothetical protein